MINQLIFDCKHSQNIKIREFGEYFDKTYAAKANEWALCLRGLEAYTTNMVCESLHFQVKRNPGHMNGKHNKRVDTLIFHIVAIEGKMIKRCYESRDGISNKQTSLNFKCHQLAAKKVMVLCRIQRTDHTYITNSISIMFDLKEL